MKLFKVLISLGLLVYTSDLTANVREQYQNTFAAGVVLSDADAVRFGVGDITPVNILAPLAEDDGVTADLRKQLQVFTLPYQFKLSEDAVIESKLAYIEQKQDVIFADVEIADKSNDRFYAGYLGYKNKLHQFKKWQLHAGVGMHLMHFDNVHQYQTPQSQAFQNELDGVYFNSAANAAMAAFDVELKRTKTRNWGFWEFKSHYHHFFGSTFAGSSATRNINPAGWHYINSARANIKLSQNRTHAESVYLKFQRVDLGGDARAALGTGHFYEYGAGLLLDTRGWTSWFDNIGIGLHFNEGSVLSGGSVVLYFNE